MTTTPTIKRAAAGTTATKVFNANKFAKRRDIKNLDPTNAIYIGSDNTVTAANGHAIVAGEVFKMEFPSLYDGEVWVIAAASYNYSAIEY